MFCFFLNGNYSLQWHCNVTESHQKKSLNKRLLPLLMPLFCHGHVQGSRCAETDAEIFWEDCVCSCRLDETDSQSTWLEAWCKLLPTSLHSHTQTLVSALSLWLQQRDVAIERNWLYMFVSTRTGKKLTKKESSQDTQRITGCSLRSRVSRWWPWNRRHSRTTICYVHLQSHCL